MLLANSYLSILISVFLYWLNGQGQFFYSRWFQSAQAHLIRKLNSLAETHRWTLNKTWRSQQQGDDIVIVGHTVGRNFNPHPCCSAFGRKPRNYDFTPAPCPELRRPVWPMRLFYCGRSLSKPQLPEWLGPVAILKQFTPYIGIKKSWVESLVGFINKYLRHPPRAMDGNLLARYNSTLFPPPHNPSDSPCL